MSKTAEEILEKYCPSMSNIYLDDNGIKFRARVVKSMEEYASQQLAEKDKEIERFALRLHEWLHEEGYEWGNKPHQMYRGGEYFWTKDLIELYKRSLNK